MEGPFPAALFLLIHLLVYIWLPDNNGRKIVGALKRAADWGGVGLASMASRALPLFSPFMGDFPHHKKR
jgi:hypothetical protein